ncbi:uncharacterized protein PV06_08751 [Exophiala oligosperma]|uniref:Aflatoxin regulatory protein domain-containing protein n=2 Tax=Chaetothyriales TaxID=34395 RepID=A0A0D2D911_9EURO|nr:uncharacterized protein PV06_08751 [Exophiala oligosperma]KAJ9644960.1 hypothetical protein H2204_001422 [Knufia peltigerae]KIW38930.1 hypothetical protein PV06_08751 [Exophiala oligosperma]
MESQDEITVETPEQPLDASYGSFALPDCNFDETWATFFAGSDIDAQLVAENECVTSPIEVSLSQQDAPNTFLNASNQPFLHHDFKANTTIRLSQLNESLARQILLLQSLSWNPTSDVHACVEVVNVAEKNPMVQALQSATEFTNVVEDLISSMKPKTPTTATDGASSADMMEPKQARSSVLAAQGSTSSSIDARHAAGTPVTLLLISSYLQIVELFSCMFDFATRALRSSPTMTSLLQFSPDLRISGLPPMKAQLYMKIMIQMAEHYLHRIQGLLCLPQEMLLSSKASAGLGLFDTVDLFSTLNLDIPEQSSLSLRDNLETLKKLLPG